MKRILATCACLFAFACLVRGSSIDSAIVAAMKFPEAKNYSWISTVQDDGRFYVIEGRTQRDGYTRVNMPMVSAIRRKLGSARSDTHTAIFKGDYHCVIESPEGWKTIAELAATPPPDREDRGTSVSAGAGSRNARAGGSALSLPAGSRGVRYSNLQLNLSHPHDEIGLIVGSCTGVQVEKDGISGTLSEESAKLLLVHPGQNEITALRASGTFRLWIRDGTLAQYEVRLAGTISVGVGSTRREVSLRQTAVTEIAKINETVFEVPEEAIRKLG